MFYIHQQLIIEGKLSKGTPYLASHPELGIPLGVFNTFDEPDYKSRVKSIKKFGKNGNPLSLEIAKLLDIKNPIPSFIVKLKLTDGSEIEVTDKSFKDAIQQVDYVPRGSQKTGYGESSAILDKSQKVLLELTRQRSQADLTLQDTFSLIQDFTMTGKGDLAEKSRAQMNAYLDILSLTDDMRKDIIKGMGMDDAFMNDIILSVTDAADEFAGFALTANDAMEMLSDTSKEIGRVVLLDEEALANATKLKELYDIDMATIISEFDKIGDGAREATEVTNKAVATAGRYGATVSKMLPVFRDNIAKINTYGFKNGIDGLAKMVAESQVLGYNMSNVYQAADKAFTPEGAVEMAAKLQMIGGAASELLDPFQLMYMAQNDVDALKDSLIKTAESAVTFNKATGEFGITPAERLRLKALAEATGQDYENLAETAIKSAKRTQAIGKLGGIPQLNEQDKELIASLADMDPSGEFKVKLGKEDLSFDKLEELISLQGDQKGGVLDKLRQQSEKDAMDLDEVNKSQLTVQEGMSANVALIQNMLTEAAATGLLGTTAQVLATEIARSGLGDQLLSGDIYGDVDLKTMLKGGADIVTDVIGTQSKSISNAFQRASAGYEEEDFMAPVGGWGGAFGGQNLLDPNNVNNNIINNQTSKNFIKNTEENAIYGGAAPLTAMKLDVNFSPLEILYDGNSLRLTPKQIQEGLSPVLIRYINSELDKLADPTII